jgi:hypothetical protein
LFFLVGKRWTVIDDCCFSKSANVPIYAIKIRVSRSSQYIVHFLKWLSPSYSKMENIYAKYYFRDKFLFTVQNFTYIPAPFGPICF